MAFCARDGVALPTISDVSVDGTTNNFSGGGDANGEVALDQQLAAAAYFAATGLAADITMYWDSQTFAAPIYKAVSDGMDVISISWGAPESQWTKQDLDALQAACLAANEEGVAIFVAAGDADADDGTGLPTVDCPASCSSPNLIACSGTRREVGMTERVWQDTPGNQGGEGSGGGYSRVWTPQPTWQASDPQGGGRMVGDVAANADPYTGYRIIVDGQDQVVGGTSAVAPFLAGLFASFGTKLGNNLAETLWLRGAGCFNKVTEGSNGYFTGKVVCGLGSPDGGKLAALFAH
jgi:kumamolisin